MKKMPFSYELDHIGIAVSSLQEGRRFYEALGYVEMDVEEVPTEKVRVGFFELGNRSRIELLEPTDELSPIAKFLAKRGPGIHHICLRVKDIRAVMRRLQEHHMQLLSEEPKPGAHGCLVAFIHPKSTGGVLIELSQPSQQEGP
jgi:methylmalonyl-CoA/ethylmalonyl-CoA epimerase